MECSALRELTLFGEPMPATLYCYACREVQAISRVAQYASARELS